MKVVFWNVTRENQHLTGVKRYEDELFDNIKKLARLERYNWKINRIQRSKNVLFGSTFLSWLYKYRCRNADLIHITEETVAPVTLLRRPKKLVITCHGLIPMTYPSLIRDFTTKVQWTLIPRVMNRADKIIAISNFTKKEIIRLLGIEENKIVVIHHGVDHSKYKPLDKEKSRIYLSLDPSARYILVVSSNLAQKRMDIVKKVFDEIRKIRDDVYLLKAGYGEMLRGERIINVGKIPERDMPILYNAANVYFHPSEYESFGLPILEAMACGVPVVTSNKASIPEVVGDDKRIVDIDNDDTVKQFVDKILKYLDKEIDKKVLRRSKKFSWEKTARQTIEVYEKVMESY